MMTEPSGAATATGEFAPLRHDHSKCVRDALDAAAALCRQRGARLTETRRHVLELIWAEHRPVGAYDLLAALARDGQAAAPPTVYRALDFLLAQGLVHRIESLNAFVGCPEPGRPHRGQFLICEACGRSAEIRDRRVDSAIRRNAEGAGFALSRTTIEAHGLCPDCRDGDASAGPQ